MFMFEHVEYKLDKILIMKTLYLLPCIHNMAKLE